MLSLIHSLWDQLSPTSAHKLHLACNSLHFFTTLASAFEKEPATNSQAHNNLCHSIFNHIDESLDFQHFDFTDSEEGVLAPAPAYLLSHKHQQSEHLHSLQGSNYPLSATPYKRHLESPYGDYISQNHTLHQESQEQYIQGFLFSCSATLSSLQGSIPSQLIHSTSKALSSIALKHPKFKRTAPLKATTLNAPRTKSEPFVFISEINQALNKISNSKYQKPSLNSPVGLHHTLSATPCLNSSHNVYWVNTHEPDLRVYQRSLLKHTHKYFKKEDLKALSNNQERTHKLLVALKAQYALPSLYDHNSAQIVFDGAQMSFDYHFRKHLYYSSALMQEQLLKDKIDYDYAKNKLFMSIKPQSKRTHQRHLDYSRLSPASTPIPTLAILPSYAIPAPKPKGKELRLAPIIHSSDEQLWEILPAIASCARTEPYSPVSAENTKLQVSNELHESYALSLSSSHRCAS